MEVGLLSQKSRVATRTAHHLIWNLLVIGGLPQDNTNVEKAFVSAAARVKVLTPAIQQTFNDTVDLSGKKGSCCLTN